ncbi:hypothetical protein UK23_39220 [Lentzea aerocolonigenes]|uniref:Uncharacterized protein n=1 Tax=Lentzea aerocolonigenes TaxID=68170 RepID=A0A0F0GF67_LENAE|nr:hypothetical protein [Lentzea aerocolonigenes]KJK42015.1 hypothetical protein UK23_39220 [Lentzea aerocolonigenes]
MTPPIPPTPPDEPVNVWAPPAGPPVPRPVYPAYSTPPAAPEPRTSSAGVVIATGFGVLVLVMLCIAFYSMSKYDSDPVAVSTTSSSPTTTTPAKPFAEVGDCVKLTGTSIDLKYDKVSCEGGLHNYTVGKVLGGQSEKCGEDPAAYTKYKGHSGYKSVALCMIPVFVDGQCYDFSLSGLYAEIKTVECGAFQSAKAKVLANTVDKAACGESPALAVAYPEIRTTYCFTQAF